jgi:hypothetical protein
VAQVAEIIQSDPCNMLLQLPTSEAKLSIRVRRYSGRLCRGESLPFAAILRLLSSEAVLKRAHENVPITSYERRFSRPPPGSVAAVPWEPSDVIVSPLFPQFGDELPGGAL